MAISFQQAKFIGGAYLVTQAPPDLGREIAFAGRSNAGKSSAINLITGQRALARVSKTPGRTQEINFFELAPQRRLVDLPGYGYAKVSAKMKRHLEQILEIYLRTRVSLQGLLLVMDIRHPLMPTDMQLLDWCHALPKPAHILLTKADKLSGGKAGLTLLQVRKTLAEKYSAGQASDVSTPGVTVQLFSSLKAVGAQEARDRMTAWLE